MVVNASINGLEQEVGIKAKILENVTEYERKWLWFGALNEEDTIEIKFIEESHLLKELLYISDKIIDGKEVIKARIEYFLKSELERKQSGFDDSEDEDTTEPQPYDPKKISIIAERWSISHIFDMIDKWQQVEMSPDFQREFVWDKVRKSQLIESLMLRIPLPAFYLAQTEKGKYQVVDGLQRLTTITEFMRNKFPLKGLEYLEDEKGRWFEEKEQDKKKEISFEFKKNILQTQLNINIIEAKSPVKVKFDVFRRVNTGGKPLNAQEIRNCLSNKITRNLINELAFSDAFKQATGESVSTKRMQAQELVLRFVSFWFERVQQHTSWRYRGNMTEFLDESIASLNKVGKKYHESLKRDFYRAMNNAYYLFGEYSFRKCLLEHLQPNARRQLVNKSLFTTWSIVLSQYSEKFIQEELKKGQLATDLAHTLEKDKSYYNSVSFRTNDKSQLEPAFEKAQSLINTLINEK